ncbi:MAG: M56 family metallopeptidase, partial [Oscillospiraceae bacterium]|nr:M56 family metallopeptidase [Oscillospiraceae bacterium]
MESLFLRVLNMSISAAVVIAVVVLMRLLLRSAPKKWRYLLWSAVGFRLCCPVSFKAVFSLFRLRPSIMNSVGGAENAVILPQSIPSAAQLAVPAASVAPAAAPITPAAVPAAVTAAPIPAVEPVRLWPTLGVVLWLCGLAVMLALGIIRYIRMKRGLADAAALEKGVFATDRIRVPFILGLLPPRVYVPAGLGEEERTYVLAHERVHIRRGDHWIKLLAYLLVAVHWFNPAVWAAFFLMSRDMEMSYDERVLRELGGQAKAYSRTLLRFAEGRQFPAPAPLGFGESDVKSRIKNALSWKKPKLWITLAAMVLCIAAVAACSADPKEPKETDMPEAADTPWSWSSTVQASDIREAALRSSSAPTELLLTQFQIRELTALLNAVPKDQIAEGRGIPSERVLELRNTGYALRFAGGVIELDCDRPVAPSAPAAPAWEVHDEALYAWLDALWEGSPFRQAEDPLGLTLRAENVTPTGCTLVFTQSGGNVTGELVTGEEFRLFKRDADGGWKDLFADMNVGWIGSALPVAADGSTELETYWGGAFTLEAGRYRIEKKVLDSRGTGDFDEYSICAEFEIPGGQSEDPLGLTMRAEDVTPTGCTLVITQSGGSFTGDLITGAEYLLEKMDGDGTWSELPGQSERVWYLIGYSIDLNGTTMLETDWSNSFGALADGHYRISKEVMDLREPGDFDRYTIYAEFEISGEAATYPGDVIADHSPGLGTGRFDVSADEYGTVAKGTIEVYEKNSETLGVRILADLTIGPEDWGGVAFYLSAGCRLESVSCSYPEKDGAAAEDPPVNVWTTEAENEKYTTMIEIGRDRSRNNSGGGTGTVVIEASCPWDGSAPIRSLAFGIECGAEEKDGYGIMGVEHREIVV